MLWQQQTKVRCRCLDRLPLIFSTILVLFIYNLRKPAPNYVIIIETQTTELSNSDKISSEKEMLSDSTKSVMSQTETTHFNPFTNSSLSNVNDVLMAYTYNSFGLDKLKERSIKTILFWNEAYGSKDYGNIRII
jgi:hypothetical protein